MLNNLSIDVETYSSAPIGEAGLYKYIQSPDFEILLLAYSLNDNKTEIVDFTDYQELPENIYNLLLDPACKIHAWDAAFERAALNKFFNLDLPASRFSCTMVKAAMLSLPLSLKKAGSVLRVNTQKDRVGKSLIKYFCCPCKPSAANGFRLRNEPFHAPEKWEAFKGYNIQDVNAEKAIAKRIEFYKLPSAEEKLYDLDQRINDKGMLIDQVLVDSVIKIDNENRRKLLIEAKHLTGLSNPNSTAQLKQWLNLKSGLKLINLQKDNIQSVLAEATDLNVIVRRMLEIRQEISKSSIKKYFSMKETVGAGGRVRGLFQFHGAGRTGRWSGRLVQVQNLVKNDLEDLDLLRSLVCSGQSEIVDLLYGSISNALSQLIRTAFVPAPGKKFICSDFSAIEARVIAWYAGEDWRLDVFKTHGKIYEASAAAMFKVPIEWVTKESKYRQKAKIAELALGYQGGPNALERMGAKKMGLDSDELPELVARWREANANICRFWYKLNAMAVHVVHTGETVREFGLTMFKNHGCFFIQLPSGRLLSYLRPKLEEGQFGLQLSYEGINQYTGQWGEVATYGGKLAENITQATARDLLAEKMLLLDSKGIEIVGHVHDEVICEVPKDDEQTYSVAINKYMQLPVSWANGLPLGADTTEGYYYKKD